MLIEDKNNFSKQKMIIIDNNDESVTVKHPTIKDIEFIIDKDKIYLLNNRTWSKNTGESIHNCRCGTLSKLILNTKYDVDYKDGNKNNLRFNNLYELKMNIEYLNDGISVKVSHPRNKNINFYIDIQDLDLLGNDLWMKSHGTFIKDRHDNCLHKLIFNRLHQTHMNTTAIFKDNDIYNMRRSNFIIKEMIIEYIDIETAKVTSSIDSSISFIMDIENLHYLNNYMWQMTQDGLIYNSRYGYLHRLIMNCPNNKEVDHIDKNTLNNKKSNLRICTHSQNCLNRNSPNIKKTSKYKGVSYRTDINECNKNKWRAQISYKGKKCLIGVFENELDAARAYDKKCLELHGEFAVINGV